MGKYTGLGREVFHDSVFKHIYVYILEQKKGQLVLIYQKP